MTAVVILYGRVNMCAVSV